MSRCSGSGGKTNYINICHDRYLRYGRQDNRQGSSVTLVDLHGDLVEEVLRHIPRRRANDVVIIDPSDTQHVKGGKTS